MKPILVTGTGVVSAIGLGKAQTLEALLNGRSGVGPLQYLKTGHKEFPVGEVKLTDAEMRTHLGLAEDAISTRTALMGMLALEEALQDAGLTAEMLPKVGFISGTTVGGMDMSEQFYLDFVNSEAHKEYIAAHDCGNCTEMTANHFGKFAFVTTLSTACSSAANAIILGAHMIRCGEADIVVVGGSECITKFHLNGFNSLMILDTEPCRPFDATRNGLNLGEGAAYLVLESEESAKRRGAKAQALLSGYGNACDAFHQTASSPEGEGAYLAMKKALEMAEIQPSDIDYINAHGTGTPNNDTSESQAIIRLFDGKVPPVSSTKQIAKTDTIVATFGEEKFETPVTKPQKNQGEKNQEDRSIDSKPVRTNKNQEPVPLISVSQPATKSGKQVSVNLYAMNGFGSHTDSNGVRMSDELANRYYSIATTGSLTRAGEVVYLAGYEERQKHQQPISIGLTASYPLTDKLSISSGVVFTKQQSDFTFAMRHQQIDKNQTLYYLGVPLNVNYRLWSYKGLNVYASVGGQADWNISMKLQTNGAEQKTEKDDLQWSINGSLGIQYNLIPQVGLYAEPGVKYYFDNGSKVQNYFKDKPTCFNLQIGLRFNLDTMLPSYR